MLGTATQVKGYGVVNVIDFKQGIFAQANYLRSTVHFMVCYALVGGL